MFTAFIRNCRRIFSWIGKYLETVKSAFAIAGPRRIAIPAFPNLPMLSGLLHTGLLSGQPGILNAAGLNQLLIDWRPTGRVLTPGTTSGRPPIKLVLDGSNPLKEGVKNWPDCIIAFQAICHPPNAASATPDLFNRRCPLP